MSEKDKIVYSRMRAQQVVVLFFIIAAFIAVVGGTIYGLIKAFKKSNYQDYQQEGFQEWKNEYIFPIVAMVGAFSIAGIKVFTTWMDN